jgi:uroporphyrinogen-III decarboxylase
MDLHAAQHHSHIIESHPRLSAHAFSYLSACHIHRSYQKSYRELAKKHPGFRERSETTELIVEISLQPYNSFKPDGVILFRCVCGCGCRLN